MDPRPERTSAEETIERFDSAGAAVKYAASLGGTRTHDRELRCIFSALDGAGVATGARVLDLPCGTGRILPALAQRGYRVVEADSSPHMVDLARAFAAQSGLALPPGDFRVASVFETPFADGEFDAVVANRLFHHFREPEVRRKALRELKRISRGPIVASFFSSRSLDGWMFRLRRALKGKPATDRIPIPPALFAEDARAAGLRVTRLLSPRPGISKQCYAVLVPEGAPRS